MSKGFTRRESLKLLSKAALAGAFGIVGAGIPAVTSAASSTGTALVFRRKKAAYGFGHVAYGIKFNETLWMFGGIEGNAPAKVIQAGKFNGGWYAFGSYFTMLSYLKGRQSNHDIYDDVKSIVFASANPTSARNRGLWLPRSGYIIGGWTCEDAVHSVLLDYGVPNLPSATAEQRPSTWFEDHLTRQRGWHYFSL